MNEVHANFRYEIKFRLQKSQEKFLYQWLYSDTRFVTQFPDRVNNSIYFDSSNFKYLFENISGIARRKKIRYRWYSDEIRTNLLSVLNVAFDKESKLNLEEKSKKGLLSSKKVISTYRLEQRPDNNFSNCIEHISNFANRSLLEDNKYQNTPALNPTLFVQYKRKYFATQSGIRLTVDDDVSYSLISKYSNMSNANRDHLTIEIKFNPKHYDNVVNLLRNSDLRWVRSSKYLFGLSKILGFQY